MSASLGAVLSIAAFSPASTLAKPEFPISVQSLTSVVESWPAGLQFPTRLMPIPERGIVPTATSLSPSAEVTPVPGRRFQKGRVYQRGKNRRWVGSYRDKDEIDPLSGRLNRPRRTVTFDSSVTSERAARRALQPYLDAVNVDPPSHKKGGKTVCDLIEEWKQEIAPNRKAGGARASLSHLRTYIVPLLGKKSLREVGLKTRQAFVTTVGLQVGRRKTVENVYGTLSSILNKGRQWGYFIPEVNRGDIEFPADKKSNPPPFFFDANLAACIINAAPNPFRLMMLVAALCGLRIGEVTALKVSSLDFKRKLIHINAALDYATRKETTPKSTNSAAPVSMPEFLERSLRGWLKNGYKPNPEGYIFVNSKGKPYLSDNVIKYGVHRATDKLGIERPKGVHVGVHCFRHGVTSELLESGTPIHVVSRIMRHGGSKVTLDHYAHIIGTSERDATEKFSNRIENKLAQLESTAELESTPT